MEKYTDLGMPKLLYLAGPMRGIPDNNFPAFMEAAAMLRVKGFEVWNPAENDFEPADFTFAKAMARDLPEVCKCDAVAVLPGWEKSQGARMETTLARELGKPIIDAYTLKEVPFNDWKPTNPKDQAASDKLDLSLVPTSAIAYMAVAMTEGDLKYGAYNYRVGGVLASVYIGAAKRHLEKFESGQWSDPKTRVPHLASVAACAGIIIDAHECGVLRDDRPPRLDVESMFDRLQAIVKHLKTIFKNKPNRYTELEHGKKNNANT